MSGGIASTRQVTIAGGETASIGALGRFLRVDRFIGEDAATGFGRVTGRLITQRQLPDGSRGSATVHAIGALTGGDDFTAEPGHVITECTLENEGAQPVTIRLRFGFGEYSTPPRHVIAVPVPWSRFDQLPAVAVPSGGTPVRVDFEGLERYAASRYWISPGAGNTVPVTLYRSSTLSAPMMTIQPDQAPLDIGMSAGSVWVHAGSASQTLLIMRQTCLELITPWEREL